MSNGLSNSRPLSLDTTLDTTLDVPFARSADTANAPQEVLRDTSLAFENVYHAYVKYVAAIALRIIGRPDDVDDIVQEVFCKCALNIQKMPNMAAAKGWLAKSTVRAARKSIKQPWFGRRAQGDEALILDGLQTAGSNLIPSRERPWRSLSGI